jgi:hypothetical protein
MGLSLSVGADSASEGEFLAKINASRAAAGLAPLQVDSGLQAHARKHTDDMIAVDGIPHSSSEELIAAAGTGWDCLGENVGRGSTPSTLHDTFMASPGHKENILGVYNYVGIGTATAAHDGRLYVTVVFMKKGGPCEPSPPAPTTTTTPPTPTTQATTTTVPPTTTTSLDVGPDKAVTPGISCLEATRFWQLCHD